MRYFQQVQQFGHWFTLRK